MVKTFIWMPSILFCQTTFFFFFKYNQKEKVKCLLTARMDDAAWGSLASIGRHKKEPKIETHSKDAERQGQGLPATSDKKSWNSGLSAIIHLFWMLQEGNLIYELSKLLFFTSPICIMIFGRVMKRGINKNERWCSFVWLKHLTFPFCDESKHSARRFFILYTILYYLCYTGLSILIKQDFCL